MRHVAVVFASLIGIAVQHIRHGGPIDLRVAGHQGANGNGPQIVGANTGQSATITAKGRANGVANEGLSVAAAHGLRGLVNLTMMQYSACLVQIQAVVSTERQ